MKLCDYKGYYLWHPTSGGKAGAGRNKTGSVQVRKADGQCCQIVKNFRYETRIFMDRDRAVNRAKRWIDDNEK